LWLKLALLRRQNQALSKASTASSTIVRRCGGHRACATKTGGSGEEEEGRDIAILAETGASEVN
jgi:hypothetical protein